MNRTNKILKGIDKSMLGMEVAPWFKPLASKAEGYNIRTLDVFDEVALAERARVDPSISEKMYDRLEVVDYVGSATEVASLVPKDQHGQFDYVISSHNFEHLPNPIKFLQGCEALLKEGGVISMAMPDCRFCFDFFRPHTVTAEWLEAFLEDRQKPTARQVFMLHADMAGHVKATPEKPVAISSMTEHASIKAVGDLTARWQQWQDNLESAEYVDSHCTVMTPTSLNLLIEDCRALGFFNFDIEDVTEGHGVEFFIRLRKTTSRPAISELDHRARRTELMHQIWADHALRLDEGARNRMGRDGTLVGAIKAWNRNRLARRRRN